MIPLKPLCLALAVALFGATPAPANHVDVSPPAGIVPTTATLESVTAAATSAQRVGGRAPVATRFTWDIVKDEQTGTQTVTRQGNDYRSVLTLGPLTTQWGQYGGRAWERNENGVTINLGKHDDNGDVAAYAGISGSSFADPTFRPRLLGEVTAPVAAYVVQWDLDGRPDVWDYYEKSSGRLIRRETLAPNSREVTTYDDYRAVLGHLVAAHQHSSDGRPHNDVDRRLRDAVAIEPLGSTSLAPPPNAQSVAFPPGQSTVALPARFLRASSVIVRVTIGGRECDFVLDSGSDGIVIDSTVAKSLGLHTFGKATETMVGTYEQSKVVLPSVDIGPLHMHDVIATSLPFQYRESTDTKVVGLLGYDFFAGAVVHIDYAGQRVEAIEPHAFTPPQDASLAVPVVLNRRVPIASAVVGEETGNNFIVDTGADKVVLFNSFISKHFPNAGPEMRATAHGRQFPFVTFGGVGGSFSVLSAVLDRFSFGSIRFKDFVAYIPFDAADTFSDSTIDGLVGADALRFFEVYFDYRNERLILVPNADVRNNASKIAH